MQHQPKKLWRKIGLEKNFLQGTSHSDQSRNTQFQESFIKSHSSQLQNLQNSSFFKLRNQVNHQQINNDYHELYGKQKNQMIESDGCQTPIQKLMSESGIQRRYDLWQNDEICGGQVNQNRQQGHVRYNSVKQKIFFNEKNLNRVIESYGNKDTVEKNNESCFENIDEQNQRIILQDVNKKNDLGLKREITYESYPLSGEREEQMIKIRLLGLGDKQKDSNKKSNKSEQNRGEIMHKMEQQARNKKERLMKLEKNVTKIKNYIMEKMKVQSRVLKQEHRIFKQQLVLSLNHMNLYIRNSLQNQFQQHLNQLNDEIAYLYAQNQELMAKIQEKDLLTKKLTDQNILLNTTLTQINQAKNLSIKNTQQTITNLQNHINSLQEKLQDLQEIQTYKQQLLSQHKTFQKQIIFYKQNQSLLTDKIKQISLQSTSKQLKIQQLQWEITQLRNKEVQIKKLQLQVSQLKGKQHQIMQKQIKIQQLLLEVRELKQKNKQIQINITQYFTEMIQKKNKQTQSTILKINTQFQSKITQIQKQRNTFHQQRNTFQQQRNIFLQQRSQFQKQSKLIQDIKREMFILKQQKRQLVEMGQLLQTLLCESLRNNSLQLVNNIQKQYNIQQYDTLYTMFAFIKQEIHHNNSKNPIKIPLQTQKSSQQSPNKLNFNQQLKNIAITPSNTLKNQSSTNLLRKTGCFGQMSPTKLSLNLTLHDIQKNYSTQIPEQSQGQHYKVEKNNNINTEFIRKQLNSSFGQQNRNERSSERINVASVINTDKVRFIGLERQQSTNNFEDKSEMIQKSLNNRNRDTFVEKVSVSERDKEIIDILNKQYRTSNFNVNKIVYQPYREKLEQSELSKKLLKSNHNRYQSVQLPRSYTVYNPIQLNQNTKKVNYQTREDLKIVDSEIRGDLEIVKSAFQSSVSCNENIDDNRSTNINKNIHKINKNNYKQKPQYPICNPNYSFSQHNSHETNNQKYQKNIFGEQSFLHDEEQYDTQSVMTTYNTHRNNKFNQQFTHINRKYTDGKDNNTSSINSKIQINNYKLLDRQNKLLDRQENLLDRQDQLHDREEDYNQYQYQTDNNKSQREDIIQKIKQRVKQKFRNSHSKRQPTYQNKEYSFSPNEPSYHITPLTTRSTYKQHQIITKPSVISTKKDEIINSENSNNILADFYQRHRTSTTPYNSQKLNQRSKSPCNHSVTRSPSNTRSRSPSNSSSVTGKVVNKYGVGYTTGLSNNKNITMGSTPRSGFSKSLIQKPQFVAYSRKTGHIPHTNIAPTYQSKGVSYSTANRQLGSGSYNRQIGSGSYVKKY